MEKNKLIKISDEEYFANEALGSHQIRTLLDSPLMFWESMKLTREPTPAMKLGSLVHCFLLEPDVFKEKYAIEPELDRRCKEYKEFANQNEGKLFYRNSELEPIQNRLNKILTKNLSGYDSLMKILKNEDGLFKEYSVFWDNFKAKIDCFDSVSKTLIDVKTANDVNPSVFKRLVFKYTYDLQLAHYGNALSACGYHVDNYKIVAIQTSFPYDIVEYELDMEVMDYAYERIYKLYNTLEDVLLFKNDTGYNQGRVVNIELPKYFI